MTTQPIHDRLELAKRVQARRRDPTRSAQLRKHARGLVNGRVFELHKRLRQTLQEHDLVGLRRNESMPASYMPWLEQSSGKLQRSEQMLRQLVEGVLESPPEWLKEAITQSIVRGVNQALLELKLDTPLDISELVRFHTAASVVEVKGISAETQRRVLRQLIFALTAKQSPIALCRLPELLP